MWGLFCRSMHGEGTGECCSHICCPEKNRTSRLRLHVPGETSGGTSFQPAFPKATTQCQCPVQTAPPPVRLPRAAASPRTRTRPRMPSTQARLQRNNGPFLSNTTDFVKDALCTALALRHCSLPWREWGGLLLGCFSRIEPPFPRFSTPEMKS
jgi:hypothetical protein